MEENTALIAVLDACVLYPASMRDILLRLARTGLYAPKWSDEINAEWMRNLLKNRDDIKEETLKRTLGRMNNAFDQANIIDFDRHIPNIQLPDPDDKHVVACAIQCEAKIIVTKNLKDFPADELGKFSMIAQHPDDFICDLIEMDKKNAIIAFNIQLIIPQKSTANQRGIIGNFQEK